MIFKIIGNFDDIDFEKMLNKLESCFEFIYYNDCLFIALRDYKNYENVKTFLKKVFKPSSFFVIKEINEQNLKKEDVIIIRWCRDNFVSLDKQRYEIEQQDRLKKTMIALDNCEKILASRKKEALKINREEEKNGRTKTQRKAEKTD